MSDGSASPEVHDDDRIDIDNEPEETIDEEADGIVDVDDDKQDDEDADADAEDGDRDGDGDGQEGLDLDMNEDDGSAYQDEPEGDHEVDHESYEDHENGVLNLQSVDTPQDDKPEEKHHNMVVHTKEDDELKELLSRPPHGSEIFIGGITRDTTDNDLRELCCPCGDIYEVRILKDKETGNNKGYAFVTFTNRENAEKAIETLANTELKGRKLRFSHSQAKHRLFIGNVPKSWDSSELERVLNEQGPGIETVELLKDPRNPGKNRGFAFVDYYNHACAEHSRKAMSKSSFRLGSNSPTVSWADPRNGNDIAATNQVKVVYVRNLPDTATEDQLRELFERHGEIVKVVLPQAKPGQPKRDFGFVHFADRNQALKAIEKTESYELSGRILEASLAKPTEKKNLNNLEQPFPQRLGGLLPGVARGGYTYPLDLYGSGLAGGYTQNRYNQPLIYGRGPPPAGMTMVPIQLPDGRLGYVLQQPGVQAAAATNFGRDTMSYSGSGRHHNSGSSGGGSSRRYRPY